MLNFFIERPIFSTVISLVILLAGALAGFNLPIAQYPQIVPPQVQVSTSFRAPTRGSWPNRSPPRSSSRSTAPRA